ncbi:BFD (2Fe-2S)-binding domain-containing protein [Haloferax gibbonsii ATCC 33959]|uniref:BFD (2Fe-2S)-binding domain-containing protein n=1 Tax=Haloferax gibbonsii (strain ATCC 33959 / DSM 4427 / JCM 8863 / NBRC 102184 / NCIMB 2188 / Ma 2.38) TaxID=1227459 RepID=M0GXQ0_HALGM|nr:DUF2703 domain-containing protein [Haloferax gibbonsii]ELZ76287.1 BFD (2Fe-2S)-binding domain-containing protein [Haloferax gibbonsii ATCC 33959]
METSVQNENVEIEQPSVDEYSRRVVTVDLLYLDNQTCERCMGTEDALKNALESVAPILDSFDTTLRVRDIHVTDIDAAEATGLAVSPTIRIDGRDVQPDYVENTCESCGELCECNGDVDCRLWKYRGKEHTTAPVDLLTESLVRAIVSGGERAAPTSSEQPYHVSENLKQFFSGGDESGQDCGCGC